MNVGRYEIQGELGKGGMGAVLLGWDPVLKRKVAIKCVRTDTAADDAEQRAIEARLLREAEAAARLRHDGIVTIHDIVQQHGSTYIVMEFVPGRMLSELTTPGQPADAALTARVIAETADALDHAHARDIIHRDVKPSNIMVDDAGAVRITDFGIAKIIGAQTQTDQGMAIGTLEYMSPEQLSAAALDGRADQFSLAVVAYRMLTGRPMYDAHTMRSLALKIAIQPPPVASSINPALPRSVDAVLAKALEKNREDRYRTCSDFAAALRTALSAGPSPQAASRTMTFPLAADQPIRPPSFEPSPPTVFERQKRRYSSASIVIAILVVVAVLTGAVLYFRSAPAAKTEPAKAGLPSTPARASTNGPPASPSPGQLWQNPKDNQPYIWIPAGSFTMGCVAGDSACEADEKPPVWAHVPRGFWMGQTEASIAAYKRYVGATHTTMPPPPAFDAAWSEDDHPMVQVTWPEARAFCEWVGGRLPSEQEWEYAARGGVSGEKFATGNQVTPADANFAGSGREGTVAVVSFHANGFGLYQMSGNVAEWTEGAEGDQRVVRGGSWNTYPEGLRLSKRVAVDSTRRNFAFGMRCVVP